MLQWDDYLATKELVRGLVLALDKATVDGLVDFTDEGAKD